MKFVLKSNTDIPVCGFKFHFPSQTRLRWEATTWHAGMSVLPPCIFLSAISAVKL
jgi:hypothetical protein